MIRWLALAFALSALAIAAVWLGVMVLQPAKPGPLLTEARKADKLPGAALVARPVRVIRLAGEPPPAEIPLPPPPPKERDLLEANQPADTLAPAPRRHDPCARYGGHRVVTHGGRHWHCRHD